MTQLDFALANYYRKSMTENNKHCALLWSHLSNEPGGTIRTCCIAKDRLRNSNHDDFTLGDNTVKEIFTSPAVQRIRNEILSGGQPDNCETCWIDEDNGKKSKRQQYNDTTIGMAQTLLIGSMSHRTLWTYN